jgi:MerR family transcriptional regulator, heat shock protein HspR
MVAKREDADGRRGARVERSEERALYIISVAAELAGMHPQTLRIYERRGLVRPARTAGNTRRYSDRDIERLHMIQRLTQQEGINLAGVRAIVEMERELEEMRQAVRRLREELVRARKAAREAAAREASAREAVEIVPLRSVRLFPWEQEVR